MTWGKLTPQNFNFLISEVGLVILGLLDNSPSQITEVKAPTISQLSDSLKINFYYS